MPAGCSSIISPSSISSTPASLPQPLCQVHSSPTPTHRGLSVGIYPTNSPEACQYILDNCKANVCVVENQKQLDKVLQVWERLPHLKVVVQYTGKLSQRYNNVYEVGGARSEVARTRGELYHSFL